MSLCYRFNVEVLKIYSKGKAAKLKIDRGFKFYKTVEVPCAHGFEITPETKSVEVIKTRSYRDEWYTVIPFNDPISCWQYKAHINKIYDGDTCTSVSVNLGLGGEFDTTFRLLGIDTPELRGDEREDGLISKAVLMEKIFNRTVTVETLKDKTGKFGRYLGTFTYRNQNINKFLLENGYAEPYE
jgi:micrococcal nuclease